MNFIIKLFIIIQYILFEIFNKLFPIENFDILIKLHDKYFIKNYFYFANLIKHFHLWMKKPINENWVVRLKKNNKYYINHYNNDERIYYMFDVDDWVINNIMMFKVNDKNINIAKYSNNALIEDILYFEIGYIKDDDTIKYMNMLFDSYEFKVGEIKNKKLCELE